MFFIIPIGSEEGVRRLPYVTIGLIVINFIIWIITTRVLGGQTKELERLNKRMLEIESYYAYRLIENDPNLLLQVDYNEIREKIIAEEIIPYGSEDYREWRNLYETYKMKSNQTVFEQFGFKPKEFDIFKMFSSIFIHANFFHLLFNMLFLWLVGCNIEDDWSWKVFLGLYLISGLIACVFHGLAFPKSGVPLVGASGAIAGIMGAFMIRHYKTKIRLAYFLWFFLRPYVGVFSIYAGVALPIWFLQQIIGVSWSMETGTAYWAHIGGFIFGAAMGASFRFLGIEKKYIEPMVEDSFEKLRLSTKMREAHKRLDTGDASGALTILLQIINEEPKNLDAPLILARQYFEKGHQKDALVMYNKALDIVLRIQNRDLILSIYEEINENNLLSGLSEKNLYRLAGFMESDGKYDESVKMYGLYVKIFPSGGLRPKAIYRTHQLFKDKLNNQTMANNAIVFLQKEYPGWLQEK